MTMMMRFVYEEPVRPVTWGPEICHGCGIERVSVDVLSGDLRDCRERMGVARELIEDALDHEGFEDRERFLVEASMVLQQ